jgi:DNA-binding FrmR family transcriptional regulator
MPDKRATTDTGPHGYSGDKDKLVNRLRRIEGQVRGIERMVEDDRYCIDIITQISAINAALDKVALGLLEDHTRHCVVGGRAEGTPEDLTEEIMSSVTRLMGR